MPAILTGINGVKGDGFLWSRDARTLIFDSETAIKAQIEARVSPVKPAVPAYVAGWDSVSRGIFAIALNNSGRRLSDRYITEAELTAYLADPAKPACHAARFCQNLSHLIVGFAGNDDFRLDLQASADTPRVAAELEKNCEALLAAVQNEKSVPDAAEDDNVRPFLRKLAERVTVRRDGIVVSVHAEVASGFNAFMLTRFPPDKK
jgi:hypothetical protein